MNRLRSLMFVVSLCTIVVMGTVIGGLAAGWRPVVIQTGSMGDTAPPGALIVASPVDADEVAVGDILVMRRDGKATVTHRVIEIESAGGNRFAITQGDANEAPDAAPHPLDGEQLVSHWIAPGWGARLETAVQPSLALGVAAIAIVVITINTLRSIWRRPEDLEDDDELDEPIPEPVPRRTRQRRRMALAAVPITGVMTVGVAWALFQGSDVVASNDFATRDCFDPQLGSVQRGDSIHAVDGAVNVAITAVDPTRSFVFASVRSAANEPADSSVQARLAAGGTSVELLRNTDAGAPPSVTVSWSVVEYSCGLTVQRGVTAGNNTDQLDVAVTGADPARSFAIVSSAGPAASTTFGGADLFVPRLTGATNLRIGTGGGPLDPARTFAWQVVTFDDPGDVSVVRADGNLAAGTTSVTLTLPGPVDPSTTFVTVSASTPTSGGADVGARMIRAHLTSPTTVEVDRLVAGEALEIHVQAVSLRDGSTVRHGTVDFDPGQPAQTVIFDPVDPSRSTAMSSVSIPGVPAGGATDHASDDVVGEGTVTVGLVDESSALLTRDATASAATFGWQVIEWAGPSWWDGAWTFRQRIDVSASSTAAPDEYTVPLTFDHAGLVTSGLSTASGADVRILAWDGATWTELDRVLDDTSLWNATDTTVWFRTRDPIAVDSTITYWLYFGNAGAGAAAADPEEVFALYEDFESGTLGDFEDRTASTGWYAADAWTRRIVLTVPASQVPSTVTGQPLLVQLTEPDLATYAQPDGSDLRFTAADGVTPLDHEVEHWDAGTGTVVAWVRTPVLSAATDVAVHLYYGAADAPDQQRVRDVWDASHDAVWHLADDPAGSGPRLDDATVFDHDGVAAGSMTSTAQFPGVAGSGILLDGVDDRLETGAVALGGPESTTVSLWLRGADLSGTATLLSAHSGSDVVMELFLDGLSAASATPRVELSVDGTTVQASGDVVTLGGWRHVAVTHDGAELTVWVDGVPGTPVAAAGRFDQGVTSMTLGAGAGGVQAFDGAIDEVRASHVVRSGGWFATHIANLSNPAFVLAAAPESGVWFDAGSWSRRVPLAAAPQPGGDLNDHVQLVEVTQADLTAIAAPSGADLVFTAGDGVTRLDHTVESWTPGSGSVTAWVRLPTLDASAPTPLFLYYGNPTAVDQSDPAGVFGETADLALLGN